MLIASETTRSVAPSAMDGTTRNLLSPPRISLTMWGATIPTNPMMPVKETTLAVIRETTSMILMRYLLTSTPMLVA